MDVSEGVNLVLEDRIGTEEESITVYGEAFKSVISEKDLASTDSSSVCLDVGQVEPSGVDTVKNDTGLSVPDNRGESLDPSTRLMPLTPALEDQLE